MTGKRTSDSYGDIISDLTDLHPKQYLICHECGNYIEEFDVYWEIDGETLCDDCARVMYQRGSNHFE